VISNLSVFSQVELSGRVISGPNQNVDFAEINLLKDSVVVKRDLSDKDGKFMILAEEGKYKFQIRQWTKLLKDTTFIISKNMNLGNITVDPTQILHEVVIEGKRTIFERKVDRLMFNVGNDLFCKGLNLMEVLNKTPRIQVENDVIKMIGKGNVRVMIDGRLLNDDEVKSRLKSLRAEDIAQVEIIPMPPAKYSANGNSGMINIIMKKDPTLGLQGNANVSVAQKEGTSSWGGINLNYRTKKVEMMAGINYDVINKGINEINSTYNFNNKTILNEQYNTFYWRHYTFNSVLKYKLTKNVEIGATIDYSLWNTNSDDNCNSTYYNKNTNLNDSTIKTISTLTANHNNSLSLSAYCDFKIDSLGKKLSITLNHYSNPNPTKKDLTSVVDNSITRYAESLSTEEKNFYQINSVMADLELPYKWINVETGLGMVDINNNSNVILYDVVGNNKVINTNGTNDFTYTENTYSAYLSASKELSKQWTVKAGLRYEYSDVVGYSSTLNQRIPNSYGEFFPSVFVLWNPNNKNSLSFSYARRVERPIFYDLNPFRYYSSINSYWSGNAFLVPQLSNNIELNYTLNNNFNVILWGYQLNKAIDYVSQFDNQNVQSLTAENCFTLNKAGVYANYTLKFFNWWKVFVDGNFYYSDSKSYRPELQLVGRSGYGSSGTIRSNFVMNKKKTLLGEISYWQSFPSVENMLHTYSFARLNASIDYSVLNDKLKFRLSASDILHQNYITSDRKYYTYNYKTFCDAHVRNILLSITYFFGNDKVNEVYKESKNADKNRASK
jgi:outer membrane receptor protein involved in Fe transport